MKQPRCSAVYAVIESGGNRRQIRCVKPEGHTGDHADAWGRSPAGAAWVASGVETRRPYEERWIAAATKILAALRELELQIPGSRELRKLVADAKRRQPGPGDPE